MSHLLTFVLLLVPPTLPAEPSLTLQTYPPAPVRLSQYDELHLRLRLTSEPPHWSERPAPLDVLRRARRRT